MGTIIDIKRVYEKPTLSDGVRVLVDRLWPRGVEKGDAGIDIWAKDLAPTTELRTWFDHDPEKWSEFQKKYTQELKENKEILPFIEQHKDKKKITLVYGAKDTEHTHALVLQKFLQLRF